MSEEILKALTQLFAIISKQDDGVTEAERQFVIRFFQQELDHDSIKEYVEYFDQVSGYNSTDEDTGKLTSVKDSVRTLGICRKINKTLTQKQKVIVLIRLLEMVGSGNDFTSQAMEIISTVSKVFNISEQDYQLIEMFVTTNGTPLNSPDLRVISTQHQANRLDDHEHQSDGQLIFMAIRSVSTYFVKYLGGGSNLLNGFIMQPGRVYLLSHGSSVKTTSGDAVFYSDLVAHFNQDLSSVRLSFQANIEEFNFANGAPGLRNVVIAEGPGKLIGIMGASGAGKTTLLNVLAGLEKPAKGEILINGLNVHTEKEKLHGVIGYVAQDDLLVEELTVYQNLYFNARLSLAGCEESELHKRIMEILTNLGLDQRKDLKVGNALDKTISGGQRKRLNIALELIREPAILFLDEPTSGLSSRDSENVVDLLKELSFKGKLIFVVIHQPSSDIFKMFDKMIIMDTGGLPVYYGSPVEAVSYFKKGTHQIDSNRGQCEVCGNVNPEQIFNILEAKVVDEYGQSTSKRKVTPQQWNTMYESTFRLPQTEKVTERPAHSLRIPSRLGQMITYATRDLLAKISNKQYLWINLLEAPLLATILALTIRYRNSPSGEAYLFRFNDNIPAYLLMSIIVALFMGLTVSAEEIIRDRKILKRESFLNLSRTSYLLSKLSILFALSAIQTLLFVVVGHAILEIRGMTLAFWAVLFSTSCFANILGLNISSAFNSVVTIYVVIPLLLIPQIILSGTLFSFDKLNEYITSKGKVPLVADIMASRWAYEAMAVYQFSENEFQKLFFENEKQKSIADFRAGYMANELRARIQFLIDHPEPTDDSISKTRAHHLAIIQNSFEVALHPADEGRYFSQPEMISSRSDEPIGQELLAHVSAYEKKYQDIYNYNLTVQEAKLSYLENHGWNPAWYKDHYFNESLSNLVRNAHSVIRVAEQEGRLIQLVDPIFQDPAPRHPFDYRTAFFASEKNRFGIRIDTFHFNLMARWLMSGALYFALYSGLLKKVLDLPEFLSALRK